MENSPKQRLSKGDGVDAAFRIMFEKVAGGIKFVVLADCIGVASGSFYWRFKKRQDLLDEVLHHWETHLASHIINDAQTFRGPFKERIYNLTDQVIR